ncbi:hypothetical protein GZ981_001626 [Clostridium perfringens]|uniref:hypothetical protein n=1 Tax=Clostridium perfringens TaxID=1502 RepID=UPI001A18CFB3|nr:hypothetical protein [Clostridium perfringens]HAT4338025.1 hypothetical protein [Clostridium perfringens]HAT4345733.1 hypothetical protein [Clostridium perfringens]HAT4362853.1 hypothetical protein [Clostridium perfringens]
MNIDNIKEVQAKSNKMISEIHFKEQCSWLRNSKNKKNLEEDFSKEIYDDLKDKKIYLELLEKEIKDIFSSRDFTNKEKKRIYELTNESFWKWKFNLSKK